MPTRGFLATLLAAVTVAACGGGASTSSLPPVQTPSPSPSAAAPRIPLTSAAFLGVQFLRPTGWSAKRTTSSAQAGNVTYTAPGRRGILYVERNDCAACVDQGLVMHGHRNGVPDPTNAVTSYFPTSKRQVDANTVTFTTRAAKPYVATGKLTVTKSDGAPTGYVVVIVTLPRTDAATAAQILASMRISSATSG
jgi:hypothetical protein